MVNLLLIFITTLNLSFAEDDHCSYFKYCGSSGGSQSSSKSHPSTSTSASFNPSNIAKIKGIGLETLFQPNNSLGFNLASGTGKFGGALISPTLENGFFGNRTIELDEKYFFRRMEQKRFKNDKINLALGLSILNKKNFTFDLGVSLKRNPKIKKINPGVGISTSIGFLNLGFSYYKDDSYIDYGDTLIRDTPNTYASVYESSSYQESFDVTTFSIGSKIGNFAFDVGKIISQYKFYERFNKNQPTEIMIFSTAYNRGNFLYNLAYRMESSPNMIVEDQKLKEQVDKTDVYFGVQYMVNRHLLLGVGYNTFLLKEVSATITLYL